MIIFKLGRRLDLGVSLPFYDLFENGENREEVPSPFKFNPSWNGEEYFVNIVKEYWYPFNGSRKE